jgi:hypothetical protein
MNITARFKDFWHWSRTEPAGEHMIKAMIFGGIIGYVLVFLAYGFPVM